MYVCMYVVHYIHVHVCTVVQHNPEVDDDPYTMYYLMTSKQRIVNWANDHELDRIARGEGATRAERGYFESRPPKSRPPARESAPSARGVLGAETGGWDEGEEYGGWADWADYGDDDVFCCSYDAF